MFTQEKGDQVCELLSDGLSLRKAAEQIGVTARTVLNWCNANPEFATQYAQARTLGYQLLADEILEISDDAGNDVEMTEHGPKVNAEVVARSRLRVDSRKWMLAKMLPKVYGDKIEHEHKGTVRVMATQHDEAI